MPQLARKTARWISNKRSGAAGEAGRRLHDRRKRHGDFRQSASHLIILVAPAASRVLRASGLQAGRVSSFPQLQHLSHHVVFVKSCHCINMDYGFVFDQASRWRLDLAGRASFDSCKSLVLRQWRSVWMHWEFPGSAGSKLLGTGTRREKS